MQPVQTRYSTVDALQFPAAITLRVLLSGSQTNGSHAIFEDIVEPGVGPGRHIHHEQDETFFFLEGSFDFEIDGVLYHMGPGDISFVPRETVHAFKNVGATSGRLRYMFTPALKAKEMFRAFFAEQESGGLTPEAMEEIAKQHNQSFVGDPL